MAMPVDYSGWTRLRLVLNWANLSTPLGLIVARVGGARPWRFRRGTILAAGYRLRFPVAAAFTIGNVIISRHDRRWLEAHPALLAHEDRHCTQYSFCVGVLMLPLYVAAAAFSWAIAGNHYAYNPFERLACLIDGGYSAELHSDL